ncbi:MULTISPECIES: polyhydroxyalkanoate depolymerase [Roseateles]|uniref:Poly(3-hydroxybutyrate) depolymerase n=1 Tax=Pelomonas aquatica TaxID=431058 RepID=A0ABU1Z403_9BURK|nr:MULTISPECIES: polyhydroxyalkanoate depolymerase [Roseateles]KQY88324.1 poly(3-hydroxybutyrate) depolymerase [Pelomonas sp. Root1444]MDR7295333.1 poly(3-hydroxybutyrate) depolymerase [Pelomonas aquatica]
MYPAYQAHADLLWPLRAVTRLSLPLLQDPGIAAAGWFPASQLSAAGKVFELAQITHKRPPWRIAEAGSGEERWPVTEEAVLTTPFATLLRFRREGAPAAPKVLVVAPMSGHFATLLRDTVCTLLQDHDVHVTDWHNVRDVPLQAGRFGLDEYTQHLIDFLAAMGPGAHVVAVCQPCVSALAAVALMAEDDHPATPASLALMAGPIDCRVNPTEVNKLATGKPIEWFAKHLISHVPWRYRGAGRRVYPGFVQLSAFMSMNQDRHANAFKDYYRHLVADEFDKAEVTRMFYEEYMAVADLAADFYLETVERVFQTFDLPRGELMFKGRRVNPAAIRRTALLTVEGERDDICSVGQTLAAQDLASSLKLYLRTHYIQPNVGHYGVFSGRRWQHQVYPLVRRVIQVSQ